MSKKHKQKEDTSEYVYQNPKYNGDLSIREFKWNEKQQYIIDAILEKETKMVLVDGIWGSGKTLMAIYSCLQLLKDKKISNILYVRNAVQAGSGTLGWLGGSLDERLSPYMVPFQQKLNELLPKGQVDKLIKDGIVQTAPVALMSGYSYNATGIILDEISSWTKDDIMLVLSRVGKFCKVIGIGDSHFQDFKGSGFKKIYDVFNDAESKDNGIHCFELQEEADIMRSTFLRYVMKKVRNAESSGQTS